jgi:cytochrome c556
VRILGGLAILGLLTVVPAGPAGAGRQEEAVDYRVGIFTGMRWHLKPLTEMVKGSQPYDAEELAMRARRLDQLAAMPWEAFLEGTHNVRLTEARRAIWDNREDFRAKAQRLQRATDELVQALPLSGPRAARSLVQEVAESCKACHDDYKEG